MRACAVLVALAAIAPGKAAAADAKRALLEAVAGKIKHVVVLMLENRSFDHLFGFAGDLLGVDGLAGDEFNYINTSNPSQGSYTVNADVGYINSCDPNHGTPQTTSKIFGASAVAAGDLSSATMSGFVEYESGAGHAEKNYCDVMSMFTPVELPVLTFLAQEFGVMDRFFASHPGPTWPNRMFALSATSAGSTETGTWYHNEVRVVPPYSAIACGSGNSFVLMDAAAQFGSLKPTKKGEWPLRHPQLLLGLSLPHGTALQSFQVAAISHLPATRTPPPSSRRWGTSSRSALSSTRLQTPA